MSKDFPTMGDNVGADVKAVKGERAPYNRPRHGLTAAEGPDYMVGRLRSPDNVLQHSPLDTSTTNDGVAQWEQSRYDYHATVCSLTGCQAPPPEPGSFNRESR
jgi:hypothetical protein